MTHPTPLFAALSAQISAQQLKEPVKLIPAGSFRALDGRPAECEAWVLDSANAAALVAAAAAKKTRTVVDYEHQTLRAANNGQPAPAAGWYTELEWREGDGLYAQIKWTAAASKAIEADEYAYISPVFTYDKSGRVLELLHVALTNNPALDDLPALSVAVLSRMAILSTSPQPKTETAMDELLEQLRWLLNLPVGSTAEDVKAQLQKLMDQLKGDATVAAAGFDLAALLSEQKTQIAALSANQVDPAKFVSVDVVQGLQTQVADLTAKLKANESDGIIVAALSDGRLLPAQEQWARDLAVSNPEALESFLKTTPAIAALNRRQSDEHSPDDVNNLPAFNAPAGFEVAPDSLALHQAALSYQLKHPGVDYITAVKTVEKQQ